MSLKQHADAQYVSSGHWYLTTQVSDPLPFSVALGFHMCVCVVSSELLILYKEK